MSTEGTQLDPSTQATSQQASGQTQTQQQTGGAQTSSEGKQQEGKAVASSSQPESKPQESKPVVPEKYDLKIPEGSALDVEAVNEITSYAKKVGLSNDQAQALLEREHSMAASWAEGQKKQLETAQNSWVETSKSDKEIGGDAFSKSAEMAKRVVERFGTTEFKKTLNETGLGNHPELLRVFVRIGKAMTEDQLVMPGAAPAARKSAEELLYGNQQT